jgi:hypothetical protein
VVEITEYRKLVGFGIVTDDRRASEVGAENFLRPLLAYRGASKRVQEARRKLYAHRATSLPVAEKAGD